MTYTLDFPNSTDAEPYEGAVEFTAVFDWVYEEAQKVVSDHLADYVADPQDEDSKLAAAHKLAEQAMNTLWWGWSHAPNGAATYRFRPDEPLMRLNYEEN